MVHIYHLDNIDHFWLLKSTTVDQSQFHAFRLGSFCRKNPIKNWCTKVDQSQWSSLVDFYRNFTKERTNKDVGRFVPHTSIEDRTNLKVAKKKIHIATSPTASKA